MNNETLSDLAPSEVGDDRQYIQELTGIPDLDTILAPLLKEGGLIIIGSETGEGRTAFASYIAGRLVARRKNVRFISPRYHASSIIGRMMSSLVPWPNEKLKDGFRIEQLEPGLAVPLDCERSRKFQGAGFNALARIRKDLDFHHAPELRTDPHRVLAELVYSKPEPDCLIIDDFYFLAGALQGGGTLSSLATELMDELRAYSWEYRIPVIVTCLLKPNRMGLGTKDVRPSHIAGFPKVFEYCDAFLGLTALVGKPVSTETREWGMDQYISVHSKGVPKLIPVLREFAFQRFLPRDEGWISDDLEERIRRLKAATKLGGCMKVRRSDLKAVAALRHRPSLNVFILALLVANWQQGDDAYGTFFYSVERIASLLGLRVKEVRTALSKLEAAKILKRSASTGRG